MQKAGQEKFKIEKVIKKKVINFMSNGKDMTIHLIVGLIKKSCFKMSQHFPKPLGKLIFQIKQQKLILKI